MASFDRKTAVGQRDYAMSRCLVDLGLRTSEVAMLRLDHIHWAQGLLTQPAAKSRQARTLPLPAPTGEAIAAYLQHSRPATACRALFVRHSGGIAPVTAPSVRSAMRRAFERAGIPASLSQVHRLRHSTATRMLAAGVPFKTIADVLGHQSFDTTGRYLAVATEGLGAIAAPWPTADSS